MRQKIAQAHTIDFVSAALAARIGELNGLGRLDAGTAAYGKLFKGVYDPVRARIAVEVGGPGALAWDPTDQDGAQTSLYYLNCRIMSIAGGTNEMQRNGIGERKLGLPREPSSTPASLSARSCGTPRTGRENPAADHRSGPHLAWLILNDVRGRVPVWWMRLRYCRPSRPEQPPPLRTSTSSKTR